MDRNQPKDDEIGITGRRVTHTQPDEFTGDDREMRRYWNYKWLADGNGVRLLKGSEGRAFRETLDAVSVREERSAS